MDLVPGTSTTIRVGFSENADDVAHQLAEILDVDTVIGADAAAHVSLLRETVREELALALEHLGMDRVRRTGRHHPGCHLKIFI